MIKTLLLLFLLASSSFGAVVSTASVNCSYLLFVASLTAANKNTIATTLRNLTKDNGQPSRRLQLILNSTWTVLRYYDHNTTAFPSVAGVTRAIVIVDADYDDYVSPWMAQGKLQRLGKVYNEVDSGVSIMRREIYRDYEPVYENKDWCLYTYEVDPSTH